MARFNHTDRTLETLKVFIFNQTGMWTHCSEAGDLGRLPLWVLSCCHPLPKGSSWDRQWLVMSC